MRTNASARSSAPRSSRMKKRRRIPLGDLMTIVFENTDTMRFQIQEMARAERMLRDEQIAHEVETYNELIPERRRALGHACSSRSPTRTPCATWLPKLTGIEDHVAVRRRRATCVRGREHDAERLTARRHHLDRALPEVPAHARTAGEPSATRDRVRIVVDHPAYQAESTLTDGAARRARRRLRRLSGWISWGAHRDHPARSGAAASCTAARVRRGLRPARSRGRRARAARRARARADGPRGRDPRWLVPDFVLPRSGLALRHGVTCLNTPGLIDPLYRGELKVLLVNTDPHEPYTVHRGDRIAQLVITPSPPTWSGSRSRTSTRPPAIRSASVPRGDDERRAGT